MSPSSSLHPRDHPHNTSGRVGGLLSVWEKRTEEAQQQQLSRSPHHHHHHSSSSSLKLFSKSSSHSSIMSMTSHEKLKICVIGNPKCGKTSLVLSYLESDRELPHSTLDEITTKIIHQGHEISLTISDTNGSDDYDRYRTKIMYPHSDVFIICYSIVSRQHYENVKLKWIPEVKMLCPNALIVLCATKCDLRDDHRYISNTSHIVSRHEVKKLLLDSQLDPSAYVECSVFDQGMGVKEVFDKAIQLYLNSSSNHHHHHHLSSSSQDKKKK
nr:unnamed protein product [Naegleria fowleri]